MKKNFIKRAVCVGSMLVAMCGVVPALATVAGVPTASAQQQAGKATGTVVDADGGIIGATVTVKGTQTGAITDMDGNFSVAARKGDVLVISYVGYATQEVKVTGSPLTITLVEDNTLLSEVVVTALGVKRERKALGYGLAEVNGEELTKAKETNVINSLAGKVAGLVVSNTAGGASGSTRVMLRGNTEMSGNNQPLYVVDGVPLDNTNFASAGTSGGYDLGDGISAINPDDIETMTVLKGPAASALYGSRASHGVILITTKKADKEKFSVEYNGSLTIDSQLAKWDNIQQIYGQGNGGKYSHSATSQTNMSWGPKGDLNTMLYFDGVERPFYIYKNNTSGFFRTGLTAQNTAIISANSGKTGMRFSFTDMRNRDILPNTHMSRDNFNLRVNTSLDAVDFDFTANYTREDVKNRPALGDSQSNIGKNLMTLANSYNHEWLKNYQTSTGEYQPWNGNDQYNKNPYWDLYKNSNKSTKDVFRLTAKAVWNVSKHFKVQGTIGTDMNNMDFQDYVARTTPGKAAGQLQNSTYKNRTYNAEILGLYSNYWGDFDFNGTIGGNIFRVDNKTTIVTGTSQQLDDIIAILNYTEQNVQEDSYKKQINSIFGSASVGYMHTYYLEGTLRGDKSSTLPRDNNTYVYPSISGSWVFSEYLTKKNLLTYGKLRASWARVGSDTDPFQLLPVYTTGKYTYGGGYVIGLINGNVKPNADLKPTMTSSFELGLEMKFFNNRLGLDFTYYNQNSTDQIIRLASSNASGYEYRLINAGKIRNRGVEIALNGRALQVGDFAWDMGVNFSKNSNKVIELTEGMDFFEIEKATWCNVSVGAEVGKNFGSIVGPDFVRTEDGQLVINESTGLPEVDSQVKTLGNASWDWTGGFYTTFSYKNWRLSASFDVKVGADLYSMSMRSAYDTGKALETVEGRDEWYASEEARLAANMSLDEWRAAGNVRGYVVPGVIRNADGTYRENDIAINPENYWRSAASNAPATFIYDNSYVKCREITLGYTFSQKTLGSRIKGLTLSFVARNPFIVWKNIPNIDPDSGYNTSGLGLEYGSLPSRRSYGFNVNLKF